MIVFASSEAKYFGPHFSSTNKRRTSSSWLVGWLVAGHHFKKKKKNSPPPLSFLSNTLSQFFLSFTSLLRFNTTRINVT